MQEHKLTQQILKSGDFDKNAIIRADKEILDETSKFAAGDLNVEFEVDENNKVVKDIKGNAKIKKITYSQTKQKDLDTLTVPVTMVSHDDEER